jgi:DNA-binding NarL/FixJ family response regulator
MNEGMLRVLLVDDKQEFLDAACHVLRLQQSVEIVGAFTSARLAIQETARLRPDLVLVDLIMPEMNGLEVVRKIRASGSTAHVVMLSIYDSAGYGEAAAEAGADGFVSKSGFVNGLAAVVDRLLRRAMT